MYQDLISRAEGIITASKAKGQAGVLGYEVTFNSSTFFDICEVRIPV